MILREIKKNRVQVTSLLKQNTVTAIRDISGKTNFGEVSVVI